MTKKSHILVGFCFGLIFNVNPILSIIGALIPDLDIIWGKYFKNNFWLSHRGFTHHFIIPLILLILSIVYKNLSFILLPISVGYFSHLLADLLTINGVPLFFSYYPRISFKLLKTGSVFEYFLVFSFFIFTVFFKLNYFL
ncbi:MAG: metal-dependent hydrolase [bacterium]|nr:metal-dependent hydrolase [bacterium]